MEANLEAKLEELSACFPKWQKTADVIDQLIDLILNYRQSGHPGGSRSKVHVLLATLLGSGMRWDIRSPVAVPWPSIALLVRREPVFAITTSDISIRNWARLLRISTLLSRWVMRSCSRWRWRTASSR